MKQKDVNCDYFQKIRNLNPGYLFSSQLFVLSIRGALFIASSCRLKYLSLKNLYKNISHGAEPSLPVKALYKY